MTWICDKNTVHPNGSTCFCTPLTSTGTTTIPVSSPSPPMTQERRVGHVHSKFEPLIVNKAGYCETCIEQSKALAVATEHDNQQMQELAAASVALAATSETLQDRDATIARLRAELEKAAGVLLALLNRYTELVNSGDCGNWNPEEEAEVRAARTFLAPTK